MVDEDDGQTEGSYGRVVAVVYCSENNWNVNAELIERGFATIYEDYRKNQMNKTVHSKPEQLYQGFVICGYLR